MARLGGCITTPGRVLDTEEAWTPEKMNEGFTPVIQVGEGQIGEDELYVPDVLSIVTALLNTFISDNVAKSTNFTVNAATDRAKLFDITTVGNTITATLPSAAAAGKGFTVLLRKADTGTGKVATSIATSPDPVVLTKQGQLVLLESDGANWIVPLVTIIGFDVTGKLFIRSDFVGIGGTDAASPGIKKNGAALAIRTGDDSADAPISASAGIFSGPVCNNDDFPMGDALNGAVNVDWSKNNSFYGTLAGNIVIAFLNLRNGQTIEIELIQDGGGTHTVTWPAGIKWYGGAPTMSPTGTKRDLYTLTRKNGVISGRYSQNA